MNRVQINRVWSAEVLQDSNKAEIFLCDEGKIHGQWISVEWTNKKEFMSIKKLIKKYRSRLREVSYLCNDEYMLYYQIERP
jgi:hypothetical protein